MSVSSMYIRTKDDVYDLKSKEVSSLEYIDNDTAINKYGVKGAFYTIYYFDENKGHYSEYDNKGGRSCDFIDEKDILKQSENLFELIDEFVVIRDSTKINQLVRTDDINYLKEMMREDKRIVDVKGAIWSDFGLKYVARLTEDGGIKLICT